MDTCISPDDLRQAIMAMNGWHQNTPLLLVFSKQKRGATEQVDGGNQAVRAVYDGLFGLAKVGIADDARKYYLHFCHGGAAETPYALRKPTDNYGKTHQRIIKDTFGQQFLTRESSGKYRLRDGFSKSVKSYLGIEGHLDLKPLVLYHYWNDVGQAKVVGDLWKRFCADFGVDKPPYSDIFSCSDLTAPLNLVPSSSVPIQQIKQLVLPSEYGIGAFNVDFWRRFQQLLRENLARLKWQGETHNLASQITAALMQDQSVFLLGDPGTGKTTIVLEAILPALRSAYGAVNEVRLCYYSLTPHTSAADLFGFQGLDGNWVPGPLVADLLNPYIPAGTAAEAGADSDTTEEMEGGDGNGSIVDPLSIPRLLFLDEANRVDIEALLSPVQAALDRMQKRMEPPTVSLGSSEYVTAKRILRIYAGNSPVSDSGRREQSRPFKRRVSVVVPPDPMSVMLDREDSFRKLALDLLEKASDSSDPEVSEPSLRLLGQYKDNPGRLEDCRNVLVAVRELRRVALTVGLVESILLRTAAHHALQPEGSLDAALAVSLGGLIAGERQVIEKLAATAETRNCPQFARWIRDYLIEAHSGISMDLDPML